MIQAAGMSLWVMGSLYALVTQATGNESTCGVVLADRLMPLLLAGIGGVVTLVTAWWNRPQRRASRRRR